MYSRRCLQRWKMDSYRELSLFFQERTCRKSRRSSSSTHMLAVTWSSGDIGFWNHLILLTGCCCSGSRSFSQAGPGPVFSFFWVLFLWLSLPCDSLAPCRQLHIPHAAVAVCLSSPLVPLWWCLDCSTGDYISKPPKTWLNWAELAHCKARWTAETVQVGTEERMGERGLSFCWQRVSFVSSIHILTGTEDSKNGAVSTFGFVLSENSFTNSSSEWWNSPLSFYH